MRLVVDASTLVAELLRERGQKLLADPRLDLYVPTWMWEETSHEVARRLEVRVSRGLPEPVANRFWDAAMRDQPARHPCDRVPRSAICADSTSIVEEDAKVQPDGRIRRRAFVEELGKYLRVITLEDGETIHNAMPDRRFKESTETEAL